ncbi:MAG: MBL fold metallo-hydrolase [Ruminococcaceae bacterium]|nr:MBL fold metallo-hydrolase [Oscillospiraceae bacterium]MBQ3215592.1 MBL fold metallo-hydrolase [Oscillospiraceae bacterium]
MKLTFLGAVHEVTGSCTLLEACGKHILIDCGLEQGPDIYENCEIPVPAMDIDAVLLTHAHMDHSGKIPALVAQGYKGPIYATEATRRLCAIMLRDSAHIQEFEAQWRNRKAQRSGQPFYVPLYTMADAERAISQFMGYPYGETIEIFPGISIRFSDAGHLLGSASIYVEIQEEEKRSILFSGDVGNQNRPLIRDPQAPPVADYVVVESTYGDRLHGERPDYVSQIASIMQDTFDRGGNLVIPSFAIGRTQELLYLMRIIKEEKLLRGHEDFTVYVDSPLAVEATRIYSAGLTDYYDQETLALLAKGIDPINFPGLCLSVTADQSKLINEDRRPKVILSASGMCEAGRIRHHLKHNLWRGDSTILFVGYQSEGTVGRKLLEGADTVRLFGEEITVKARILRLAGSSGHADRDMLTGWLAQMGQKPKKVFVNHGDDEVCDGFARHLEETLGVSATAPFSGDEYDLLTGECTARGVVVKITKVSDGRRRANTIFDKLLAAGKRLLRIIEGSRGLSNKELARFTDQIESLCDKYSKK